MDGITRAIRALAVYAVLTIWVGIAYIKMNIGSYDE